VLKSTFLLSSEENRQIDAMVLTKIVGGCTTHEAGNASMANNLSRSIGLKKPSDSLQLQLHPFASEHETGGLIVKIQPPREPEDANLHHVPCDLVLSIDISGSMRDKAPAPSKPGEEESEDTGLRIIDLVKHAARTIVATLDSRDRLGIVTFTNQSKVRILSRLYNDTLLTICRCSNPSSL
jgi:hypothetical protein